MSAVGQQPTPMVDAQCNGQCMADKVIYENAQLWIQQQQQQQLHRQLQQQQQQAYDELERLQQYEYEQLQRHREYECQYAVATNKASYVQQANEPFNHYQQPRSLSVEDPRPFSKLAVNQNLNDDCQCSEALEKEGQHLNNCVPMKQSLSDDYERKLQQQLIDNLTAGHQQMLTTTSSINSGQLDAVVNDSGDELGQVLADGRLIQQAIRGLSDEQRQQNCEQIKQLLLAAIHQKSQERERLEREEHEIQRRLAGSQSRESRCWTLDSRRAPASATMNGNSAVATSSTLPRRLSASNSAINNNGNRQDVASMNNNQHNAQHTKPASQLMESVDPLESTESMVNAFATVAVIDDAQSESGLNKNGLVETWVDGFEQIGSKGVMIRSISGCGLTQNTATGYYHHHRRQFSERNRIVNSAGQLRVIQEEQRSNADGQSIVDSTTAAPPSDLYVIEVRPNTNNSSTSLTSDHVTSSQDSKLVVRKQNSPTERGHLVPPTHSHYYQHSDQTTGEIEYAEIVCKQNSKERKAKNESSVAQMSNQSLLAPTSEECRKTPATYDQNNGDHISVAQYQETSTSSSTDQQSKEELFTRSCMPAAIGHRPLDDSVEDDLITKSYHGGYCSRQTSEILNGNALKKDAGNRGFLHRFGASLSRAFNRAFSGEGAAEGAKDTDKNLPSMKKDQSKNGKETIVTEDSSYSQGQTGGSSGNSKVEAVKPTIGCSSARPTVEMNLQEFCIINRPSVVPSSTTSQAKRSPGSTVAMRTKRSCSVKRAGQSSSKCAPFGCTCRRCCTSTGVRKRNSVCKKPTISNPVALASASSLSNNKPITAKVRNTRKTEQDNSNSLINNFRSRSTAIRKSPANKFNPTKKTSDK